MVTTHLFSSSGGYDDRSRNPHLQGFQAMELERARTADLLGAINEQTASATTDSFMHPSSFAVRLMA